jgi:hypothetical protein
MAKRKKVNVGAKLGFRSGLEETIYKQIAKQGITPQYEAFKIPYVIPASNHTYTPDFQLPNGIIIETKGRFVASDRKKHLLVKKQHPDLDIRFVFQNAKGRINKGSKTTYADWCVKNGFIYADKEIPYEWFKEPNKQTDGKKKKAQVSKRRGA